MVASIYDENPRRARQPPGVARILPNYEPDVDAPYIPPDKDKPDPDELKFVPEKLHYKWLAFSRHQTSVLPLHREYDHSIEIEEGSQVPNLLIYNLSRKELHIL